MKPSLQSLIENEINGNLAEAKRIALRFSVREIRDGYMEHGHSGRKALLTARWLKGADCYQAACDAR